MATTVKWYGERVTLKVFKSISLATEAFMFNVWDTAIDLCPVDTGELQRSLRIEVGKVTRDYFSYAVAAGVGFSDGIRGAGRPSAGAGGSKIAYYAVYQELGFNHYRSGKFIINPYLRPAFNKHKNKFKRAVRLLQAP